MIFGKTYSKLTFVLLILFISLFVAPVSAADDQSSLLVMPSADNVIPGEPFTIDVLLIPAEPVSGVQFDLSFVDDSGCTVANIEEGDFFSKDNTLTTFGTVLHPDSSVHATIYSAALGPYQVYDAGNLISIQMIAGSSTGYFDIGLSDVIVSNSNSQASQYRVENATVLIDSKPTLSKMESLQIEEGSYFSLTPEVFDPDNDPSSFSVTHLPEGASFDSSTGTFEWTPSGEQLGEHVLEFKVSDAYLSDQQSVMIFVYPSGSTPDADNKYMSLENDVDLDDLEDNAENTQTQSTIGALKDIMWSLLGFN